MIYTLVYVGDGDDDDPFQSADGMSKLRADGGGDNGIRYMDWFRFTMAFYSLSVDRYYIVLTVWSGWSDW